MNLQGLRLRQRDDVTCGPSVAVVAGALMDPAYGAALTGPDSRAGLAWFAGEQCRVHAEVNRVWPRRLGTTPMGMASALSVHSVARGVEYRWRVFRGLFGGLFAGRRDPLADVLRSVDAGWPVAMLVGRIVPRHWVLIVGAKDQTLCCYEPSSGGIRSARLDAVRAARLTGLGYPRPFAFALPRAENSNV
jgi:hypothetical protein